MAIFDGVVDFFNKIFLKVLSILPNSPFRTFYDFAFDNDLVACLNYFIPFDFCFMILELWCTAMLGYYIYGISKKVTNLTNLLKYLR